MIYANREEMLDARLLHNLRSYMSQTGMGYIPKLFWTHKDVLARNLGVDPRLLPLKTAHVSMVLLGSMVEVTTEI